MKLLRALLFLCFFICTTILVVAQNRTDSLKGLLSRPQPDTTKVNLLLEIGKAYSNTEPREAIRYANEAKALAEQTGFIKGVGYALKNIGLAYYGQGNYAEVLFHWQESLRTFQSINDKLGESNLLNNIGAVYFNRGDYAHALDYYFKSLKIAEQLGDKLRTGTALSNIGAVYYNDPTTYEKALEFYLQSLKISEESGDLETIGTVSVNIGEIYAAQKDYTDALLYFKKSEDALRQAGDTHALPYLLATVGQVHANQNNFDAAVKAQQDAFAMARQFGYKLEMARVLIHLGTTYSKFRKYQDALDTYKKAMAIAEEIGSKFELKNAYEGLAISYEAHRDYQNAYHYQRLSAGIKDSLYSDNAKRVKNLERLQFDFDIEKKQSEINLLTKDRELQTLEIQKQRSTKNSLFAGLGLVIAIAFFLYRNNQIKVKANKLLSAQNVEISKQKEEISSHLDDIDRQKVEIESLMLNILPVEVAQELRKNGAATPRSYDSVTILFTDFKDFTRMAEVLSAEEVVVQLNECFIAFDNIVDKFGLEKIKTIGDAYMCVAGIPSPDDDHAYRAVKAGLAMQEYIQTINLNRIARRESPWELRVGINTGSVVAGVVGHKKFAYDIWGNAVNLAARMEANSEVGKVNISETTYQLVKHKFDCSHRGKILAKNVGEVDMYFVECEMETVAS